MHQPSRERKESAQQLLALIHPLRQKRRNRDRKHSKCDATDRSETRHVERGSRRAAAGCRRKTVRSKEVDEPCRSKVDVDVSAQK